MYQTIPSLVITFYKADIVFILSRISYKNKEARSEIWTRLSLNSTIIISQAMAYR
jgi:hypothetical protein